MTLPVIPGKDPYHHYFSSTLRYSHCVCVSQRKLHTAERSCFCLETANFSPLLVITLNYKGPGLQVMISTHWINNPQKRTKKFTHFSVMSGVDVRCGATHIFNFNQSVDVREMFSKRGVSDIRRGGAEIF